MIHEQLPKAKSMMRRRGRPLGVAIKSVASDSAANPYLPGAAGSVAFQRPYPWQYQIAAIIVLNAWWRVHRDVEAALRKKLFELCWRTAGTPQ